MLAPYAASHHDLIKQWTLQYDASIQSEKIHPFVYPVATFGAAIVLLYLLIPHGHSRSLRNARFLVWIFNVYWSIWAILHCKSRIIASGFGISLTCSWSILWTAILLLFKDAQKDFMRIERTEGAISRSLPDGDSRTETDNMTSNGHVYETDGLSDSPNLRQRDFAGSDGSTTQKRDGTLRRRRSPTGGAKAWPAQRTGSFAWQVYPKSSFIERLDWVADVFSNFRGMGWNWRIHGLPPPPRSVQEQLRENSGSNMNTKNSNLSTDGVHVYHTEAELLRSVIPAFIINYLMLDALKTIMMRDKYYWGLVDHPPPSYLPSLILQSPTSIKIYRLVVMHMAIVVALKTFFLLGPIFFVGILGAKRIGARGEPWMYPDAFGSFRMVFDRGLAGWWGGWWHQSFRYAFETPSKILIAKLGMERKSFPGKLLQLIIAFSVSGLIHASGSFTMPGDNNPLGPFLFFFLQSFGIIGQVMLSKALEQTGVSEQMPKVIRQISNFMYTYVWFYYVGPLMCDDFARGGMWLFEPLPFSLFRGLGFGDIGDGWWCWGGQWVHWHTGKHWWETGFAV